MVRLKLHDPYAVAQMIRAGEAPTVGWGWPRNARVRELENAE